jgi:putative flavoprotein involved in K+ transport
VVLDQAARPAEAWRNHRWDSFTLNTPKLEGGDTTTRDPNGFMTRAEIVGYLENFEERHRLPVRYGVQVRSVKEDEDGGMS